MYKLIKERAVNFPDPMRHKIYMSEDCKDFITKMLKKDPGERLGTHGGCQEVLEHPWFKSLDVNMLLAKEIVPPYIPELSSNLFDVSAFETEFTG